MSVCLLTGIVFSFAVRALKRFVGMFANFAILKKIAFAATALALAPASWALETAQGHVTIVESSYMPASVAFQVDVGSPSCPLGTWLTWSNANVDNVKSTFALLMAAINSGNRIQYYINNGDTTCQPQFLHALSS